MVLVLVHNKILLVTKPFGFCFLSAGNAYGELQKLVRRFGERHLPREDSPGIEVHVILEIPEGTVASRLYHARRSLKEALEEMGAEYP